MKTLTAFALLLLMAGVSRAAVIFSGTQNIPIPTTFNGIYIDIDGGLTAGSAFTGWDINPFFGGAGIANSTLFQPARSGASNVSAIVRLDEGALIDGSLTYSSGFGGSGNPNSHLGVAANQFAVGDDAYLGFKLTLNDNSGSYYGWMHVTFTNNSSGGFIHDWAYESTGASIAAGSVPEPGRMALVIIAVTGLVASRRRRETC